MGRPLSRQPPSALVPGWKPGLPLSGVLTQLESPEVKKEAKLPATPVTTKIAHLQGDIHHLATRGQRVRDRRRYSQQLHGGEEHCVAVTVNIAALYAAFEGPYQHRANGEPQLAKHAATLLTDL